jgi:hypothetical protein
MRFSPVNPVARGHISGTHTEKSLLGSELKFSVVGGKKKRGVTRESVQLATCGSPSVKLLKIQVD